MHRWRNPDESHRNLERQYAKSGQFQDGINLLASYLRKGNTDPSSAAPVTAALMLYQALDSEYQTLKNNPPSAALFQSYEDLSAETVLIQAAFELAGHTLTTLTANSLGHSSILCRYNKCLVWDYFRGYTFGTTQSWIDDINDELIKQNLVLSRPQQFHSYIEEGYSWNRTKEPCYVTGLLVASNPEYREDSYFRVVWKNIYFPDILDDRRRYDAWLQHFSVPDVIHSLETHLTLEDEPILAVYGREYRGPNLMVAHIKDQASRGRNSIGSSPTKRVSLIDLGPELALETLHMMASKIYFAESFEDYQAYSGGNWDLYWPPGFTKPLD